MKPLIILLIIGALMLQTCTVFHEKSRENLFLVNFNKAQRVTAFVLNKFNSLSRLTCLHRCKFHKECKSINFNTKTKHCELLSTVPPNRNHFENDNWENVYTVCSILFIYILYL